MAKENYAGEEMDDFYNEYALSKAEITTLRVGCCKEIAIPRTNAKRFTRRNFQIATEPLKFLLGGAIGVDVAGRMKVCRVAAGDRGLRLKSVNTVWLWQDKIDAKNAQKNVKGLVATNRVEFSNFGQPDSAEETGIVLEAAFDKLERTFGSAATVEIVWRDVWQGDAPLNMGVPRKGQWNRNDSQTEKGLCAEDTCCHRLFGFSIWSLCWSSL